VMLIAARQPSETPDMARADAKPEHAALAPGQPKKAAAAKPFDPETDPL